MTDTTAARPDGWRSPARWAARATSAGLLLMVGAFAIGEGPPNPASLTRTETAQLLLFGGICAGMALGWQRERLGGALSLASLLGFYGVEYVANGHLPDGWAFPALAVPGVLFLLAGHARGSREAAGGQSEC